MSDIINGMLKAFIHDVYVLLDLGATLSFVTPYIFMKFEISPQHFLELFNVFTPVGESVLSQRVYRDCPISIYHKDTLAI